MKARHRAVVCFFCMFVLALALPATGLAADAAELSLTSDEAGSWLSLNNGSPFHATANAVVNQRLIEVPGTATLLMLWDEVLPDGQAVPFYAISLDGRRVARVCETSYLLKLRHARFDPTTDNPMVEAGLAADGDCHLYIVQFVTQPLEEFRTQIGELGGTVCHFISNHAHIVKMDSATADAVAELPFVRWVGAYHPAYRLDDLMRYNQAHAHELFPLKHYNIQVFEAGNEQKNAVGERIGAIGGKVEMPDAGKYLLEATLTPEQLFEVVRWDEVLFVDPWGPYEEDMNNARELGGANYIETVAGYAGDGVRAEVFDSGFNLGHVDFASRPLILHGSVGVATHGASTSGICFGDGTGDPTARGLLPEGQGIVADYHTIGLAGQGRYDHSGELIQSPYYAIFQTSSVGSPRTVNYTTISADTDAAIFDFDVVHCQSQSNSGWEDSRPQAWAKNIISGGGVRHYDTLTMADDCWCNGASTGPASDGRIKPDLSAFYDNIRTVSGTGSTAYTSTFGGTSGATPIICGYTGLFFDMWSDGIFGNPVDPQGTVFENSAHVATAKAMMINNATQYPFSGTSHDLTRVHQGWGWPNVQRMYDMRDMMFIVDETELLTNLSSVAYPLTVEAGEPELRVTLCYADPPGNPAASEARINDLTLRVTSPSGTVYWGNYGLLANNYSQPGGSANTVDTVENVFIDNPETGVWVIEIFADEVIQDGHVETAALDADFGLVVSGVIAGSSLGDMNCDGVLNAFDIDPFVLALTDPAAYAAAWPNCDIMNGDVNGDGVVNAFDIDPFVDLLTGP